MPLRSPAAPIALLLLLLSLVCPAAAGEFRDSGGRQLALPDRIVRVMPANQAAEVLVFVLAPGKLTGWSRPLSAVQRGYLPARYARLPVLGQLTGPNPAPAIAAAVRQRPTLIIEMSPVDAEAIARADQIQQQTGIPYLLLDNRFERIPDMLRRIGALLGEEKRGDDLATYAMHAIGDMRGRLLISPASERPRLYYGRRSDGLETGMRGSGPIEAIEQAGAINVAASLGPGGTERVTRQQVIGWNPAIIIAADRGFYTSLQRDPGWRGVAAVRNKRIYHAPDDPFGWIDEPAGVNRLLGLYWLSALLYPDIFQEDVRTMAREFYDKFYGVKLSDKQVEALMRTAEAHPGETRRETPGGALGEEGTPSGITAPPSRGLVGPPPGRPGYGAPPAGGLPGGGLR
jgi:iron complex transport system substrate-binding protein